VARAYQQVPKRVVDGGVLREVLAEGAGVGENGHDSLFNRAVEIVMDPSRVRHLGAVLAPEVGEGGGESERRKSPGLALDVDQLRHAKLELRGRLVRGLA